MVDKDQQQVVYLPVQNLRFDPQNPRLPSRVNSANEQEIFEFMIRRANVIELMGSIGEGGYFAGEPLLVVQAKDDDHYDVVEGNRRLAAVKLLLEPNLAPVRVSSIKAASDEAKNLDRINEIPSLVFGDRDEILTYLGYRHITGIQTWGALAKARYLQQLLKLRGKDDEHQETDRELAKGIGSKSDYVGRQLAAIAIYDVVESRDYFDIPTLDEESIDFSVLGTALNYTNIADFVGLESPRDRNQEALDMGQLKELVTWMFKKNTNDQTILGESRNLRMLAEIVASPEALAALRRGHSLDDAFLLTEGPTAVFRDSISSAKGSIDVAWNTFRSVSTPSEDDSELLREIIITARRLRDLVEQTINEPDLL